MSFLHFINLAWKIILYLDYTIFLDIFNLSLSIEGFVILLFKSFLVSSII